MAATCDKGVVRYSTPFTISGVALSPLIDTLLVSFAISRLELSARSCSTSNCASAVTQRHAMRRSPTLSRVIWSSGEYFVLPASPP